MERLPPRRWIDEAEALDVAVYAAVAATPTPGLDHGLRRLTRAADHSKLNVAAAGLLALAGGRAGRRAARDALVSVAATSFVVNAAVKPVARRRRPDRPLHEVPLARHVAMPTSRSLPSGHSAAAFAFATGAAHALPHVAVGLRVLAAVVGYSRVHAGVHYPGDVVAGALIGTSIAQIAVRTLDQS
jgi:undecaprenyl-diphosphatase